MKPKILFIMHYPPPVHGASLMGQYIRESALINEAFQCHYIKPSAAKSLSELKKVRLEKFTFLLSFHYRLIKNYLKIKPTLCYFTANSWGLPFYRDFITILVLKILRAKIIVHFHNKSKATFRNKKHNKLLYRFFFKGIRAIFLADVLADEFRQYIAPEKIYICPNGIPITVKTAVEKQCPVEPFSFLFLSNMMRAKGVLTLLEACSTLKTEGYNFRCEFVGQWSDISEDFFTEKVAEYGIDACVQAYGAKYYAEKQEYFLRADAFVFPSFDETMGLVLLEAMEFSLACVSTNVGGIPTIVKDGQSGLLVEAGDAGALAEKMKYLIKNPQLCIEMGKTGRTFFEEKFCLQRFEEKFLRVLESSTNK